MMSPTLTLVYVTARRDPRIEWFWYSLARECAGSYLGLRVVVVDLHHGRRPIAPPPEWLAVRHVAPKPTVWQGANRLTSRDYFAAANARNTGLCHAADGYVVFVDDLSVLARGWLAAVRESQAAGRVVAGAYRKVSDLQVRADGVYMFRNLPKGWDSRWPFGGDEPVRLGGGAMYGCSCGGPVEAFLSVNGFDEDCDSTGGEDYLCGLMLERAGYPLWYDRRMLTFEWEEGHSADDVLPRVDKGLSPDDASHRLLNAVLHGGRHAAPNYFGPGGIREVRRRVLAGEPFPAATGPRSHWFDGQPLREM